MHSFDKAIATGGDPILEATSLSTLQANLGRLCNMSCRHCHVEASPTRHEIMDWPVMEAIIALAEHCPGCRVDVTGGAPELNPHFRRFVSTLHERAFPVQVRTNLAVLLEPGQKDLPAFFRHHRVELVASLPCYLSDNVDAQRGRGTYDRSIEAIRLLNREGYGTPGGLPLNLVYNPGGPFLPPPQAQLEAAYRRELSERFGISFTRLLTLANMPIGRFLDELRLAGKDADYRRVLAEAFNPQTLDGLMCRHQVSIDWDGRLYDCDFNLALGLPLSDGAPHTVFEAAPASLGRRGIRTGEHCFGCTAGSGSSCGGSLVA